MLRMAGTLLLGAAAGYFSGLVGLGGGVIIVPALVLIYGFSQPVAQGTTLAMLLPPIGLFAVLAYQQKGLIDWRVAALLCIGFLIGSPLGAKLAVSLPPAVLKKVFAVSLFVISIKMFWGK
jgi:uncharacterized protein